MERAQSNYRPINCRLIPINRAVGSSNSAREGDELSGHNHCLLLTYYYIGLVIVYGILYILYYIHLHGIYTIYIYTIYIRYTLYAIRSKARYVL